MPIPPMESVLLRTVRGLADLSSDLTQRSAARCLLDYHEAHDRWPTHLTVWVESEFRRDGYYLVAKAVPSKNAVPSKFVPPGPNGPTATTYAVPAVLSRRQLEIWAGLREDEPDELYLPQEPGDRFDRSDEDYRQRRR